jgi:hypothetical protein
MFKRLGFLVALICAPLPALAAAINIEYIGHVTSSDYLPYGYGQQVSGNIQIDLSKSNGDELPEDYKSLYTSWTNHDLIAGYYTDEAGYAGDRIEIFNNSNEKYGGNYIDYLGTIDVVTELLPDGGWKYYTMQLSLGLAGLDWIINDDLDIQDIFVNDSSVFDWSFGVYGMGFGSYDSNGELQMTNYATFFSFDSVKITSVSVPEPSVLLLLLVGVLGMGLRRKMAMH